MSDDFDFEREYVRFSFRAAEEAGFAIPFGAIPSASARLAHVEGRSRQAISALADLQLLLDDDDPHVQNAAQEALCCSLNFAVPRRSSTQDRRGVDRILDVTDAFVGRAWPRLHPGQPDPRLADPRSVLKVRSFLMLSTLLAGVAATLLVASGNYVASLAVLLSAVAADLVEGALGRVTKTESPVERWFACLISHLSELFVIAGIAWDQQRLGHANATNAVLVAGMAAIFGSFVRVSALQAGLYFWRSMAERALRFAALVTYIVLAAVRSEIVLPEMAAYLAAILFGCFGLWEVARFGLTAGLRARREPPTNITLVVSNSAGEVKVQTVLPKPHRNIDTWMRVGARRPGGIGDR